MRQFRPENIPFPEAHEGPSKKLLLSAAIIIVLALSIGFFAYTKYFGQMITTTIPQQGSSFNVKGCTSITKPGTYYLAGRINAPTPVPNASTGQACIAISASNVQFIAQPGSGIFGNGPYVASAAPTYGIIIQNASNVKIEGIPIVKFSYGIYLSNSQNSQLIGVRVSNSTRGGIYLDNSYNNTISGSVVRSSAGIYGGITITGGGQNILSNDTSYGNEYYGIYVDSLNNRMTNDNFTGNPVDLECRGLGSFKYSNYFANSKCINNNYCDFAYCSYYNRPINISSVTLSSVVDTCGGINYGGTYVMPENLDIGSYLNLSGHPAAGIACIEINAPNVKLDCMNNTISNAGYGIYINGEYNISISNCNFQNDTTGIYAHDSFGLNLSNMAATGGTYAMYLFNSTKGNIKNQDYHGNQYGIYLNKSSGFLFNNVNSSGNAYGVYFESGEGNAFNNNRVSNNTKFDLYCSGDTFNAVTNLFQSTRCGVTDCSWASSSCASVVLPPLATYPISACGAQVKAAGSYYLSGNMISNGTDCIDVESSNVKISCDGHYLISAHNTGSAFSVINRDNVSISGCGVQGYATGILAENSSYISLKNIKISGALSGVELLRSSYGQIMDMNVTGYENSGFYLGKVNGTVAVNDIAMNGDVNATGFSLMDARDNLLTGNKAQDNAKNGFLFINSTGNQVSNNTAYSNSNYDYYCDPASGGINAQAGGINDGLTKSGCAWLVELTSLSTAQCYPITQATAVILSQDMLFPYGSVCYDIHNSNVSSATGTTINCNGHTVMATNGGTFVSADKVNNVKVENCYIKNFSTAMYDNGGYEFDALNNTISHTNKSIIVSDSQYPIIGYNRIDNSSYGIYLQNSYYGSVKYNSGYDNNVSIELSGGTTLTVTNNTSSNGGIGIYVVNSTANLFRNNRLYNSVLQDIACTGNAGNQTASGNEDGGGNICAVNSKCYWMTSSPSCAA